MLNQYQRRTDLVPNLVETVKGFAQQERTVLEAVTTARAQATSIKVDASTITDPETFETFQDAQAQLSSSLGRLLRFPRAIPTSSQTETSWHCNRNWGVSASDGGFGCMIP